MVVARYCLFHVSLGGFCVEGDVLCYTVFLHKFAVIVRVLWQIYKQDFLCLTSLAVFLPFFQKVQMYEVHDRHLSYQWILIPELWISGALKDLQLASWLLELMLSYSGLSG